MVNTQLAIATVQGLADEVESLRREKEQLIKERNDALENQHKAEQELANAQPLILAAAKLKADNDKLTGDLAAAETEVQNLTHKVATLQTKNRRLFNSLGGRTTALNTAQKKVRSLNGKVSYLTSLRVLEGTPQEYEPLKELLVMISRRAGYEGNIALLADHYNMTLPKPRGTTPMSLARNHKVTGDAVDAAA